MRACFTVPGEPTGKGRARTVRNGGITRTFTPEKTVLYENLIKVEFQNQCRGVYFEKGRPLEMLVMAYYAIPASASKKKREQMIDGSIRPLKKADSSNVLKAVEDALNKVAYDDDVQIVETHISRFYGDIPRVEVLIKDIEWRKEKEDAQ